MTNARNARERMMMVELFRHPNFSIKKPIFSILIRHTWTVFKRKTHQQRRSPKFEAETNNIKRKTWEKVNDPVMCYGRTQNNWIKYNRPSLVRDDDRQQFRWVYARSSMFKWKLLHIGELTNERKSTNVIKWIPQNFSFETIQIECVLARGTQEKRTGHMHRLPNRKLRNKTRRR